MNPAYTPPGGAKVSLSTVSFVLLAVGNFIGIILPYMQKTCDVAEKAILAKKKLRKKVRKSRQNVDRDKSA